MRLETRDRRKALINVTSLIDVVFLLLIFFVVTSTFLERPGLDLSLPKSGTAQTAPRRDVTVRIDADGSMFVGDERVPPERLAGLLRERLDRQESRRVVLEADERTTHGHVVQAMDAAREAGATALVVATRPKDAARASP